MKSLSAKEIIRILKANDFLVARQRGSHVILKNGVSGFMVSVPLHGGNKPIPIGTFHAIVKQSHLSKDTFSN